MRAALAPEGQPPFALTRPEFIPGDLSRRGGRGDTLADMAKNRPPPYRFDWSDYVPRLVIGNFIAIIAIAVFAFLDMMPFWPVIFPVCIHIGLVFMGFRDHARKATHRDFDY
jgi:hypothetical protein